MANNNTDGEIILGLDISQTKSTIEKDLEQILKQINNLEVSIAHANLDNQAISELQKKLTQISNLTVNVSNINVSPNQVRQAQQTGQQIGQQIQRGIQDAIQKGNFRTSFEVEKINPKDIAGNVNKTTEKIKEEFEKLNRGVVTVHENMKKYSNGQAYLDGLVVSVKRADGVIESLQYKLNNGIFEYTGGTINDNGVVKQINAITDAISSYKQKVAQFKSTNEGILSGINFTEFENAMTALENGTGSINAVKNAYKDLGVQASNITKELSGQLSKASSAAKNLAKGDETIASLKADFNGLNNVPKEITQQLNSLGSKLSEIRRIESENGRNVDWAKAYREWKDEVDALTAKLRVLQKEQANASSEQVFKLSDLKASKTPYMSKVENTVDAQMKYVQAMARNNGWTNVDVSGIERADGMIKKLTVTYTDAEGAVKRFNMERRKMQGTGRINSGLMQVGDVQVVKTATKAEEELANAIGKQREQSERARLAEEKRQATLQNKAANKAIENDNQKIAKIDANIESGKYSQSNIQARIDELKKYGVEANIVADAEKRLNDAFNTMSDKNASRSKRIEAEKQLQLELQKTGNLLKQQKSIKGNEIVPAGDYRRLKVVADLNNYLSKNTAMTKESRKAILQWIETLASSDDMTVGAIKNINSQLKQLDATLRASGRLGLSTFDKAIQAWKKFGGWGIATGSLMAMYHQLTRIPQEVTKLDTTLVELSKVSDLTASGLSSVTKEAYDLGKQVAKTGTDVLDSITSFKRAGYDIKDSMAYAEEALKTTNISENLKDAGEAADSLVNIMKGFQTESPEFAKKINDAVNQVSNTQAVGFDNLVDGATRLSAVANQAGMSFEQMLGTLTGGYEILGNMEKVATGQITIFSRLQSIQLDGEDEVATVSKLQETFNNATKGAVNIVDSTTGQLRNVYDILDDMANVWSSLDKNTREALAIEAAGIRQKNVFLALMQNWQGVEDAVESAKNSMNSADEENQKYLDSIEGRMNSLESSFQRFSQSAMSSGLIKGIVSGGTVALDLLTAITDKVGTLLPMISGGSIFAFFKNLDYQKVLKIA